MPFDLNISQILLIAIGTWQTMRLIQGFGLPSLPIRLMSFGYFVNYVLGASLSYHFDPWLPPLDVYAMQVDAAFYFSFVLPYMLIMVAFEKQTSALVDQANVHSRQFNARTKTVILLAVLAGVLLKVAPSGFRFYLYLTSLWGAIQYMLAKKDNRLFYFDIWFWLAFFWPLFNSLTTGMFYDLILLGVFLMGKLMKSQRRQMTKGTILLLIGVQGAIVVQNAKPFIRSQQEINWEDGMTILTESFDYDDETSAMAAVTVRLNQGYLLSHFLKTHQTNDDLLERGNYLEQLLVSVVFPRFLVSDKLMAGDRKYFEKHTSLQLVNNTSMGLGLIAESCLDFGPTWGLMVFASILMAVFLLFRMTRHSEWFLVFFTMSVFYLIRPDCDLITGMGHLVKCFLAFFVLSLLTSKRSVSNVPPRTAIKN